MQARHMQFYRFSSNPDASQRTKSQFLPSYLTGIRLGARIGVTRGHVGIGKGASRASGTRPPHPCVPSGRSFFPIVGAGSTTASQPWPQRRGRYGFRVVPCGGHRCGCARLLITCNAARRSASVPLRTFHCGEKRQGPSWVQPSIVSGMTESFKWPGS